MLIAQQRSERRREKESTDTVSQVYAAERWESKGDGCVEKDASVYEKVQRTV